MTIELAGTGVLVTRPAGQAEKLCSRIQNHGGQAYHLPVIKITPPVDSNAVEQCLNQLDKFQLAIFVSPNAVQWTFKHKLQWPDQIQVAAVGLGTVRALQNQGIDTNLFPTDQFHSEALLALPAMHQVDGKNIIIFRGQDGRPLLGDTLKSRGANVVYLSVYQRQKPSCDLEKWLKRLPEIQITTVTSNEGLSNLFSMLGSQAKEWLCQTPMVVVSQRGFDLAKKLGVETVQVAARSDDESIVEAVISLRRKREELP